MSAGGQHWATRPDRGSIAHVARAPAERQHPRDLALRRPARDRIDWYYAQPLDVETPAEGVNIPAGHLNRQFKAAYGGNLVRIQELR